MATLVDFSFLSNPLFEAIGFAVLISLGVMMLFLSRRGGRGRGETGGGVVKTFLLLSGMVFTWMALTLLVLIFVNFLLPVYFTMPAYISFDNLPFAIIVVILVWVFTYVLFLSRLQGRQFGGRRL